MVGRHRGGAPVRGRSGGIPRRRVPVSRRGSSRRHGGRVGGLGRGARAAAAAVWRVRAGGEKHGRHPKPARVQHVAWRDTHPWRSPCSPHGSSSVSCGGSVRVRGRVRNATTRIEQLGPARRPRRAAPVARLPPPKVLVGAAGDVAHPVARAPADGGGAAGGGAQGAARARAAEEGGGRHAGCRGGGGSGGGGSSSRARGSCVRGCSGGGSSRGGRIITPQCPFRVQRPATHNVGAAGDGGIDRGGVGVGDKAKAAGSAVGLRIRRGGGEVSDIKITSPCCSFPFSFHTTPTPLTLRSRTQSSMSPNAAKWARNSASSTSPVPPTKSLRPPPPPPERSARGSPPATDPEAVEPEGLGTAALASTRLPSMTWSRTCGGEGGGRLALSWAFFFFSDCGSPPSEKTRVQPPGPAATIPILRRRQCQNDRWTVPRASGW